MKGLFFSLWLNDFDGFSLQKRANIQHGPWILWFFNFLTWSIRAKLNFLPQKMVGCLNVLKSLFFLIPFFEVLLGHTFSPLFYFGDRWCLNDNGWQKRLSVVYFSPTTPHDFSPIAEQQKKKTLVKTTHNSFDSQNQHLFYNKCTST